ncbi:hypothetical protein [Leucobacter aridicollis]|uniref:hypothetical protein n=1 Tax=Leucobacter aridicollis TaxID=283878 RepID=UPI00216A8252|nr:hypothetical protein [Leucobacter aridicollis]MCS3426758.1 hypothetical protein [Leucobacter aridicollis]
MSAIQDPLDHIRKVIAHHEGEAEYASKSHEIACTEAEAHEAARKEHLTAAYKWRKILEREEAHLARKGAEQKWAR